MFRRQKRQLAHFTLILILGLAASEIQAVGKEVEVACNTGTLDPNLVYIYGQDPYIVNRVGPVTELLFSQIDTVYSPGVAGVSLERFTFNDHRAYDVRPGEWKTGKLVDPVVQTTMQFQLGPESRYISLYQPTLHTTDRQYCIDQQTKDVYSRAGTER